MNVVVTVHKVRIGDQLLLSGPKDLKAFFRSSSIGNPDFGVLLSVAEQEDLAAVTAFINERS
jgi:hypothetical protein